MDKNRALGVNSGSGKRAARPGSLTRRRSSQRLEPKFEPKTEWIETAEAHVLVLELPGFKEEDIKVQPDGGENITISGERLIEDQLYREGMPHPRRRMGSRFKKLFHIPMNVDIAGITSRFENDILYITFNKLKAPIEVKSNDVLDQGSKGIPQVGESSAKFIEAPSEKRDDKTSSNKLDQSLKDENVTTPNVAMSNATQDEKGSNNKLDQSPKDEKIEAPEVSAMLDAKASSNKQDQSPRDEKLETPRVAKTTTTRDDKELSNQAHQSPRDEKVETPGGAKSTITQVDKASNNKLHQSPSDEKVETLGGAKSTTTHVDKASSDKPNQSPRDEKVESQGGANSSTTQDEKALSNKQDQSLRDEMVETIDVAKSSVAQDEKVSNNKPNQSPRDENVQTPKATKLIAAQLDDEKVATPKVVSSSTTQEAMQAKNQLEVSNKLEDLAKHPSSLNEEKLVDSNALPNQFELSNSKQEEVEMKVGNQHDQILVKYPKVESNAPHGDQKQEEKVSSPKFKKEDDCFDCSRVKEDKHEKEKQSILKSCTYVSQLISSKRELMITVGIVVFSLGLYITSKLT